MGVSAVPFLLARFANCRVLSCCAWMTNHIQRTAVKELVSQNDDDVCCAGSGGGGAGVGRNGRPCVSRESRVRGDDSGSGHRAWHHGQQQRVDRFLWRCVIRHDHDSNTKRPPSHSEKEIQLRAYAHSVSSVVRYTNTVVGF